MSTSFIRFLDELEHNKTFLFLKNEKIENCSLKNLANGQLSYNFVNHKTANKYIFHSSIHKKV
jgi:hypothetical protein